MVKEAYFHGKRGPLTEHAHTSGVPLSIQTAATMVFMTTYSYSLLLTLTLYYRRPAVHSDSSNYGVHDHDVE
jgi:hypothetical protein